jgi:hypothetical protein
VAAPPPPPPMPPPTAAERRRWLLDGRSRVLTLTPCAAGAALFWPLCLPHPPSTPDSPAVRTAHP